MFAASAVVLALAAAVAHAQDLTIQTPPLAQASPVSISSPCLRRRRRRTFPALAHATSDSARTL